MESQSDLISEFFIKTSYGEMLCRSTGNKKDPLYLMIHGSGPKSSSQDYVLIMYEYAVRFSQIWPLYMVAFDCPGYGNSSGSKQSIRSYPTQVIEEVIFQLKQEKKAFILMGLSQGGCAIFNAALENKNIADCLVQDRPVYGEIKKLISVNVPLLLIYNVEDDGHPIKQGRLINKTVEKCELVTYKYSEEPFWMCDKLFETILYFICRFSKCFERNCVEQVKTILEIFFPVQASKGNKRLSVGKDIRKEKKKEIILKNNSEEKEKGKVKKKDANIREKEKEIVKFSSEMNIKNDKNYKNVIKNEKYNENVIKRDKNNENNENIILKKNEKNDENIFKNNENIIIKKNNENIIIDNENNKKISIEKEKKDKNLKETEYKYLKKLESANNKSFEKNEQIEEEFKENFEKNIEKNSKNLKKSPSEMAKSNNKLEEINTECPICLDILWKPIKLPCSHFCCLICLQCTIIYNPKCPLCREDLSQKEKLILSENAIDYQMKNIIFNKFDKNTLEEREKRAKVEEKKLEKVIKIEYGNYSQQIGKATGNAKQKYFWILYVKTVSTPIGNPISSVEFDINPGIKGSKPIVVSAPPFELQRNGNYDFECEIKIIWKNKLKLKAYSTTHGIKIGPAKTFRQFIQKV